jgi:penicillin G amidase
MKTLKKVLIALLILILVALVAGGLFVRQVARKALPDYNQSVELNGLHDGVRIYRDQHAIPHIYANNEHDLYMAVGYVMAQDRLWQMDLLRRVTTGRLSEIFGEDMIGADQLLRALRIPEKSARVLAGSDPSLQQAMEAFSRGVNQYIEQNLKKLPPEFTLLGYQPEPWQPLHSANLVGYMSWDLSGSWGTEVVLHKLRNVLDEEKFMQIIPNMDYHQTFVFPEYQYDTPADPHAATAGTTPPCRKPAGSYHDMFALLDHAGRIRDLQLEIFSGSNSWVVSGEYTETGLPLFANDMHLGFGAPGIWMQMHQVVEGKLNVSGVALPGQPFIIVGHNENIAWGMTNLYVDETDFYMETTDASKPGQYLFNGEWKDMLAVNEQIAVKGADTVERVNMFTHRGPVISTFKSLDDQVVSMRWTGNEYSNEMRTIYLLNRASNWDEFKDALTSFISISQNITYADVHGNIGQQAAGGVPVRKEGNGMFVSPGEHRPFRLDRPSAVYMNYHLSSIRQADRYLRPTTVLSMMAIHM